MAAGRIGLALLLLHGAHAKERRGPLGTRSITLEEWDLETVGKEVMVAFVDPQDPDKTELVKTWSVLADLHDGAAHTGVYEVDCAAGKVLCQKVGKILGPFVKYGRPSTNFSSLQLAEPRGSADAEVLGSVAEKLGPVCSVRSPAGCGPEEKKQLEALSAKTARELEDATAPMRERLVDYFGRRRAFEEENELVTKGVQQAQQQMKDAQAELATLKKNAPLAEMAGISEEDQKKRETDLNSKETSWRNAWKDRIKRRDQNAGRRKDLDEELYRLTAEAKSFDFNLKRMVLDAKRAKEEKSKASEEL